MASYTDVFERKETKYRLNKSQYLSILDALRGRMEADQYGATLITSVYYDTSDRSMICRSLEKPLYKEKLRLRTYGCTGVPNSGERVFVEIKKKYDGIVYKRRIALSYRAACAYLSGVPYEQACRAYPLSDPSEETDLLTPRSVQIAREIDALITRYPPLFASVSISCKRTAFAPVSNSTLSASLRSDRRIVQYEDADVAKSVKESNEVPDDLRITFDEGICYRDLFAPKHALCQKPLLSEGEVIMEIKSSSSFPLWLAKALADCGAYPSSFSKYGEAYRCIASSTTEKRRPRFAISSASVYSKTDSSEKETFFRPRRVAGHIASSFADPSLISTTGTRSHA